ncbi:MAG: BtrH N-terminal domain-containing protein, partial [gamma proteobacterium symbiont of Ctena orbiculata]
DAFRSVLMAGLELMREEGVRKWLSDDRNNSILSAEDSAWSQDYWLPRALEAGWKYWAVLPPRKARGRINMERLMEFVGLGTRVEIQLFSDPDAAWQWLKDQDRVT